MCLLTGMFRIFRDDMFVYIYLAITAIKIDLGNFKVLGDKVLESTCGIYLHLYIKSTQALFEQNIYFCGKY